jgi:integrase
MKESNVVPFPKVSETPCEPAKETRTRMKNGLVKKGTYYHYKRWDPERGKNVWVSTRQKTLELAQLWVEANVLNPRREKLLEEALGLKPIKKATFNGFVRTEYWPYAEEHNKESTIRANEYKIRWLERFFKEQGIEDLTSITEAVIEDYKVWRKRRKKSSSGPGRPSGATVNRELKLLSKICKYAVKRGYLREDPTKAIEYYKEKPAKRKAIDRKTWEDKFPANCNPGNLYATTEFFDFLMRTGARFSEVTGLTWEDVDFEKGDILFRDTKNGEDRQFPMTDYLRAMLGRLYKTKISEYVFPGPEGKKRKDARKAFDNTLKRAGLPRMCIHELRHSFVSACASMGMTWEQTSALTGHKSYAMYLRYRHLFPSEQKRILERWDEGF